MQIVNKITCLKNRIKTKFAFTPKEFYLRTAIRRMSGKCKVAVVQFTATNNKLDNLNSVSKLVKEAAEKNAKV